MKYICKYVCMYMYAQHCIVLWWEECHTSTLFASMYVCIYVCYKYHVHDTCVWEGVLILFYAAYTMHYVIRIINNNVRWAIILVINSTSTILQWNFKCLNLSKILKVSIYLSIYVRFTRETSEEEDEADTGSGRKRSDRPAIALVEKIQTNHKN